MSQAAKRVHAEAIVIDGVLNAAYDRDYFGSLRAGGYTAAIVTLAMPFYRPDRVWQTLRDYAEWRVLFAAHEESITHVKSAKDIHRAKHESRVGIIFGMQDGGAYAHDLDLLPVYRDLGLLISSLAYNRRNALADGCVEPADAGLSRIGRDAVDRFSELGIQLDLSHMGDRSSFEALERFDGPVVLTHSNPRALCDNPRNVPDELIDAVAGTGGVVGVSPLPMLLARKADKPDRSIEDLFTHIDYVVERVGAEHVGFGSDFYKFTLEDAIARNVAGGFLGRLEREPVKSEEVTDPETYELLHPPGIRGAVEVPNITHGLLARGYSEDDVRGIIGGNFLRVFEQTWQL